MSAVLSSLEDARTVLGDDVQLTRGTDLHPEPIQWLWKHWLALGKFHLLAGAPGVGKTTLALGLAATVTIGGRFPDGERCEPGNVLIWSGEDDPADTLLPRLLAAGADRSRCFFVSGSCIDGESVPFDPSRDMVALAAAAERIGGVALLIVDPVVSAVTGDGHRNAEVRRDLQPLVDLAGVLRCAVLGITHFSKAGQGSDPAQRVIGSVAFSAVSRVVLVAAKTKGADGELARVLARAKSNIGPDDGGFHYDLMQREALPGIEASCVAWGAAVAGTARDLLTDPDAPDGDGDDADDACGLLREELTADCWTPSDTASAPLKAAGFTKKQIWSASKKLRVVRKKGGMAGGWYWRLPGSADPDFPVDSLEDSAEDSEGSTFQNGESLESSGALESSGTQVLSPAGDDSEVFQ